MPEAKARRLDGIALSKPIVFAACLLPLAWIAWDVVRGNLGPDPVAQLEHRTGDWALRFLLASLAMTPLRLASGLAGWLRYRRMLGLFAFFCACLHLAVYVVIDLGGFWSQLLGEIAKKPYITAGFVAWLLMVPLAVTSTRAAMRRLGRNWQRLHRLVYLAGLCATLHYLWLVKSGERIAAREPLIYFCVFALLIASRVPSWLARWRRRNQNPR